MLQSFLQIFGITDTRLRDPQTCFLHGIGDNLLPPTYVLTNSFLQFCFAKDLIVYDPIPQRFQNFVVQWFDFLYFQKYFLYFKKYFFFALVLFCMVWNEKQNINMCSVCPISEIIFTRRVYKSEFISPQVSGNISRVYLAFSTGLYKYEHGELYIISYLALQIFS